MGRRGGKLGRLDRNFTRELLGPFENAPPVAYSIWVGGRSVRRAFVYNASWFPIHVQRNRWYPVARHTLAYMLFSICDISGTKTNSIRSTF
ncbi:hypothetical protein ACVIN2_005237 [Bradyrhizobium sp. USDA 3650]